jgi:hypothetical protein
MASGIAITDHRKRLISMTSQRTITIAMMIAHDATGCSVAQASSALNKAGSAAVAKN